MSPAGTRRTCSRGHIFYKSSDCPVCPKCWSGYSRKRVRSDFPEGLSAPALRALERAGIRSLTQIAKRSEREIADLHGMGPKGIRILKAEMERRHIDFVKKKSAPKRGGKKPD